MQQVPLAVARIVRNLFPDPRRQSNRLLRVLELDFGKLDSGQWALVDVHHPDQSGIRHDMTDLLDVREATQRKELVGVPGRDLILELSPADPVAKPLNRYPGPIAPMSDPGLALPEMCEKTVLLGVGLGYPGLPTIAHEQELPLDLGCHDEISKANGRKD